MQAAKWSFLTNLSAFRNGLISLKIMKKFQFIRKLLPYHRHIRMNLILSTLGVIRYGTPVSDPYHI